MKVSKYIGSEYPNTGYIQTQAAICKQVVGEFFLLLFSLYYTVAWLAMMMRKGEKIVMSA